MSRNETVDPRLPSVKLLEIIPTAAYVCGPDGLIVGFNPHAERIWGRAPALNDPGDRYCGSFRLFTPDGTPVSHDECWMALTLREGRAYQGHPICIEQPCGDRVDALAFATPIRDEYGTLLGAMNVLVDASSRPRIEDGDCDREFSEVFENAPLAVHYVGPDGIILRANQAELEMLGYERTEYVGRHIAEFHVDADVIEDILTRLRAGETVSNREARVRCRDGSIKWLAISSSVIFKDGEFIHTRCFAQDITRRKHAEASLREADARKDEFLAMLGHELRNPLAPIVSAVEYLRREGPVDSDLDKARDVIDRQVTHMARLIDDLLNVARITRGKLRLQQETVELEAIICNAMESASPIIAERRHELSVSFPDEPIHLNADAVRLSQVFTNLLVNAAKYTPDGGHLNLTVERVGSPSAEEVVVMVKDDGIGIAPADVPIIFDMFVQLNKASDRYRAGLGVGLTLVRSIVEMHGGAVEAQSDGLGRGSTFIVRLPVAPPSSTSPRAMLGTERATEVLKFLVVDDHDDTAEALASVLAIDGHEVRTATSAAAALETAGKFDADVILLDIGLPDMDGYRLCGHMRATPMGKQAFILAVTGWGQAEDKRRALEAGFDQHATKPIDMDSIYRMVATRPRP